MKRAVLIGFAVLVAVLMLSPASAGGPMDDWYDGIEKDIFGHSFDEESWSTEVTNVTEKGDTVKFAVSYLNHSNVQMFLVALHSVTNPQNGTGTLPYQMLGIHFITDEGQEVFISALLAFLLAYNDTNANGIPDPATEKMLHVIPFGADSSLNGTYPPTVTSLGAKKISDTHYQFGMRYQNLYALVTENYLASAVWKTGWIAKFDELAVTYDIEFDEDTGEVTTETFYEIGEVTELWAFILGIPIPVDVDKIPDTMGLAVAHYVTVFTSKYDVKGSETGNDIATDITKPIDENITIETNQERAFDIGFRGDYTLYDRLDQVQKESAPAINILLQARPADLLLVLWQLGFSAHVFSFMAYGISDTVQKLYTSPRDLKDKSLNPFNKYGFRASALWYVVCFPEWNGYRIEHDPVYTAYASPTAQAEPEEEDDGGGACGSSIILVSMLFVAPGVVMLKDRRKQRS